MDWRLKDGKAALGKDTAHNGMRGQLPLFEGEPPNTRARLNPTPLEMAQYRLMCTVNATTAQIPEAMKALMEELGARESTLYLLGKKGNVLAPYISINRSDGGLSVSSGGPDAGWMAGYALGNRRLLFSVPNVLGVYSTLFQFNLVPGDFSYESGDIKNGNERVSAIPLFLANNGGAECDGSLMLGVLELKGERLMLSGNMDDLHWAVRQSAMFMSSGARMLSKIVSAKFDHTTGLPTKRECEAQLSEKLRRFANGGRNITVVMFDLDGFKAINDSYGHQKGDETLLAVSELLSGCIRRQQRDSDSTDWLFRWGGEEFAIIVEETHEDSRVGRIVAERIRSTLAEKQLVLSEGVAVSVTASIGVVDANTAIGKAETHDSSPEDMALKMMRVVDRAMYDAKEQGKNRVIVV